jgi:MFS family permease
MAVFLLGSALCGFARSLPELVAARVVQGAGGAMMTPVGRQILLGSVPREGLVSAMAWFTTPALVGPLVGPPIAGFILSVADWRWIFFVNLPIGILGMAAVSAYAPVLVVERPGRFDTRGFALTCLGITALVVLAETAGVGLTPAWAQVALGLVAVLSLSAYVRHSLRVERPILNLRLLRVTTYRTSLLGGAVVRLGLGAIPFLMPLLLQVGIGWSPAKAGLVSISTGVGAIACKPVAAHLLRRFGFRTMLVWTVAGTALFTAIPAAFREWTPIWVMAASLFLGGFLRSMQFTSTNSLAYADVENRQVSQASTLATVAQQMGMSFGVSFGALLLHLTRGHDGTLRPESFVLPFVVIGAVTLLAVPIYLRLDDRAGASLSGR